MIDNVGQVFMKSTSYLSGVNDELEVINEPFPPNPELIRTPVDLTVFEPNGDLMKLIETRRSIRDYEYSPISMIDFSKIIWGIQGVTAIKGALMLRTVASAGNRHPINTYIVVNNVEKLIKGLYFYDRLNNNVALIRNDNFQKELVYACFDQTMVVECSATFIWTAVSARTTERYNARGYRYMLLDAGHIGGQFQLVCHNLGLGSCNIAAFYDDALSKLLNIKNEFELPIYMATVGWPKSMNP